MDPDNVSLPAIVDGRPFPFRSQFVESFSQSRNLAFSETSTNAADVRKRVARVGRQKQRGKLTSQRAGRLLADDKKDLALYALVFDQVACSARAVAAVPILADDTRLFIQHVEADTLRG